MKENSPLRIMINGKLISAPENVAGLVTKE